MAKPAARQKAYDALRRYALAYPEAHEDSPWGHSAIKVRKKTFVFLHCDDNELSLSTKLPASSHNALMLPFAEPTGYGLAKSGWVTARFTGDDELPLPILHDWIEESYRAIAPKKLVVGLATARDSDAPHPNQ
jgi:predicted DNA-binding protein (MmcQ/YjbR family)